MAAPERISINFHAACGISIVMAESTKNSMHSAWLIGAGRRLRHWPGLSRIAMATVHQAAIRGLCRGTTVSHARQCQEQPG